MLSDSQIRGCSFVFGVYTFILSYYLFGYYEYGDQEGYRKLYQSLNEESFVDGYYLYNNLTGGFEPVYYAVIYLFSGFFEKDLLLSLVNFIFGYHLSKIILVQKVSPLVLPLIAVNFYFIVLLFSAERLKFGLLFLSIYFLIQKKSVRHALLLCSFLSQFSIILLYVTVHFKKGLIRIKKILVQGKIGIQEMVYFVLSIVLVITFYLYFSEKLLFKINHYLDLSYESVVDVAKTSVFIFLAFMYRKRYSTLLSGTPILFASFLFGSERMVMFAFFYFMFFAFSYKRGLNAGVLLSSLYFGIKGLFFINTFMQNGTGFLG